MERYSLEKDQRNYSTMVGKQTIAIAEELLKAYIFLSYINTNAVTLDIGVN
jgi:hypothetical protein